MMTAIFAHRGASLEAPENSLQAFEAALATGADGIELDVLLTKDKVPLVTHYNDLSILFRKKGLLHKSMFGDLKDIKLEDGSNIPTLTQVLERLKGSGIKVVLDLKKQPFLCSDACQLIGGIALEFIPLSQLVVSSFHPSYLRKMKFYFPQISRALIVSKKVFTSIPLSILDKFLKLGALHPELSIVTSQMVEAAHKRRWKINPWVVNTEGDYQMMKQIGVDGVFTDNPRLLKEISGQ